MNIKLLLAIALMHLFPAFSQINNAVIFQEKVSKINAFFYTFQPLRALPIAKSLRQNPTSANLFAAKQVKVLALIYFFIAPDTRENHILAKKKPFNKKIPHKIWNPAILLFVLIVIFTISHKTYSILKRKKRRIQLQKDSSLELKVIELQEEKEISKYYRNCLEELNLAFVKTTEQILYLKKQTISTSKQEEMAQLRASVILTHKDWLTFKQLFDKNHPNFTSQLAAKNKYLTTAEIRFMMLKKINLTNQDMARSQGVGNNTIHKTSSRIRQKLLCTNEELNALINIL